MWHEYSDLVHAFRIGSLIDRGAVQTCVFDPRLNAFLSNIAQNDAPLCVSHELLDKLIHYDPACAMALIAVDEQSQKMLGVVRLHDDTSGETAEFTILVRSRLKDHGVGWLLMKHMFQDISTSRPCKAKCCRRISRCLPCAPNSAFT
jgi:hypothetical protein